MTKTKVKTLMNPVALMTEMARIGWESQMVIAMRMAGLVGLWPTGQGESHRMVAEKQSAAQASMRAAIRAAAKGATPDQVMSAALKPIGRRTHSNARRLSRGWSK